MKIKKTIQMSKSNRSSMTAREKKIYLSKISEFSEERLGNIWKINRLKNLDSKQMEQFELIRKEYKNKTGKNLPEHTSRG